MAWQGTKKNKVTDQGSIHINLQNTFSVRSFKADIMTSITWSFIGVLRTKILGPVTGVKGTQHWNFG